MQSGALIGDLAWAGLALSGVALVADRWSVRAVLGLIGSLFLGRLAWAALRSAWSGRSPAGGRTSARGDFGAGALSLLANPVGLAFWAGVGGAATATTGSGAADVARFLGGFALGSLGWCVGFAVLVAWGRRFLRTVVFRWVDAACGVVLGSFGLRLGWRTVRLFLP